MLNTLLDTIRQYDQLATILINSATLLIWVLYAHLLLLSYRNQRRPTLLISEVYQDESKAEVLVSNMSEHAVFIEAIIVAVITPRETVTRSITTDVLKKDSKSGASHRLGTFWQLMGHTTHESGQGGSNWQSVQGPLTSSGTSLRLGTFRKLVGFTTHGSRQDGSDWRSLEVHVIFRHGADDHPVAVSRQFDLEEEGDHRRIRPKEPQTKRLSTPLRRKRAQRWLRESS